MPALFLYFKLILAPPVFGHTFQKNDLPVVFSDFKEDLGFLGIKESKNKQKTLTLTTFTCFLQLCR